MFNQFGESSSCKAGKGGLFANDVYRLTDSGEFSSQSASLLENFRKHPVRSAR